MVMKTKALHSSTLKWKLCFGVANITSPAKLTSTLSKLTTAIPFSGTYKLQLTVQWRLRAWPGELRKQYRAQALTYTNWGADKLTTLDLTNHDGD